ncbi:MAG: molybdate ABC transporter permease subunit [Chloroflexi bacterium]|nr:molybdate ABC transporter permease subunit [Chloroflexota bacterium]
MMWSPLWLSLRVALFATLLGLATGLPIAYILARKDSPWVDTLGALTNLPLVLPPTVLGYYLLVAFGYNSPLGRFLDRLGIPLVFTWRGAVLAAWMVSMPLIIQSAGAAFAAVDRELEDVARTLGESEWGVFWRVTFPLARPGILAGTLMAFARALGDFGTTLMVAGNIPGRTQTMAIAIYDAVQMGDQQRANALVLVLTLTALAILLLLRRLTHHLPGGPT